MKFVLLFLISGIVAAPAQKVLFIRGGSGTVGFFEGGADEQGADIDNFATGGGNHGWGEFGAALIAEGFAIEQVSEDPVSDDLVPTPVPLDTMELAQYDVVVFGSNNAEYTTAQVDAFMVYINAGGAGLFISDANFGQDWPDASNSDQHFLDRFGLTMNQDRGTYSVDRGQEFVVPAHPILNGVEKFDGEGVTPITVSSTSVSGVTSTIVTGVPSGQQVRRNNRTSGQGSSSAGTPDDATLVVATAGSGRIAGHFDRNTFFNLNGAGTNINRFDNEAYARNLINWLAGNAPFDPGTGNYAPRGYFSDVTSGATLTVVAKDPDGSIASVALEGFGSESISPYRFDISGLPPGDNILVATITDNEGSTTDIETTVSIEDPSLVGQPLDRSSWVLTANRNSGEVDFAVDGDLGTRWATRQFQQPGQSFGIDFGARELFERIVIETPSNPDDYARGYILRGSDDNINFTELASGAGDGPAIQIILPEPVTYRYVQIEQTGSSGNRWWSIDEINVLAPPVDSGLPLGSWLQFYFGATPDALVEDGDGDGLNTFAEFAFNTDPTIPELEILPVVSTHEAGVVYFTFPRWKEPNGVTYEIESSSDLGVWDDTDITVETVGAPVDNGDGTEVVTLQATVEPGLARHYVRLKLAQ